MRRANGSSLSKAKSLLFFFFKVYQLTTFKSVFNILTEIYRYIDGPESKPAISMIRIFITFS